MRLILLLDFMDIEYSGGKIWKNEKFPKCQIVLAYHVQ